MRKSFIAIVIAIIAIVVAVIVTVCVVFIGRGESDEGFAVGQNFTIGNCSYGEKESYMEVYTTWQI